MLEDSTRSSQVETARAPVTEHHGMLPLTDFNLRWSHVSGNLFICLVGTGGWVRMPAKSGSVLSKFRNYQI
jgi:hypothetical protein